MLSSETKQEIRQAFVSGQLQVESIDRNQPVWRTLADVLQHHTAHKKAFKVATVGGCEVVVTEDHSLFLVQEGELHEILTRNLEVGSPLAVVTDGSLMADAVISLEGVNSLELSYDLSVPGPENFVLSNGVVAHNSYSIGGISLDIDKASKYEAAMQSAADQFDKQLEKAKLTVKVVRGLQQPKYGTGIRSSFGPHTGRGVLSPRKFVGI